MKRKRGERRPIRGRIMAFHKKEEKGDIEYIVGRTNIIDWRVQNEKLYGDKDGRTDLNWTRGVKNQ